MKPAFSRKKMILQDLKLNEQNLLLRYRDRNLDRANKPPYNKVLSMTNYFLITPVIVNHMKKNLDIMKPRYSEQILPVPWPFVISTVLVFIKIITPPTVLISRTISIQRCRLAVNFTLQSQQDYTYTPCTCSCRSLEITNTSSWLGKSPLSSKSYQQLYYCN